MGYQKCFGYGKNQHKKLQEYELQNLALQNNVKSLCPFEKDCRFVDSEVDLYSYRIILSRCTKHGGVKGKSMRWL